MRTKIVSLFGFNQTVRVNFLSANILAWVVVNLGQIKSMVNIAFHT